jgi:flagellar motility protein MotE (MotC chaperone)
VIVTRQRRKPFPWRRLAFCAGILAVAAFALAWAPSRNFIANGPAAPLLRSAAPVVNGVAAPLHFAAQDRTISDLNGRTADLQKKLDDAGAQIAQRDKQISALQTQLNQTQQQLALKGAAPVQPARATVATNSNGQDLSAGATPDMRRTAQIWASMDADAAAKVVQRLPTPYVARIFALMPADAVGQILESVPASYAAQLTKEHPELER